MAEKKIPTLEDLAALKAEALEVEAANDHQAQEGSIYEALDAASTSSATWRRYSEVLEEHLGIQMQAAEKTSWTQTAAHILKQMRKQNGLDPKPYESENGVRYPIGHIVFASVQFKPRPQYIQEKEPYQKLYAETVDPTEQVKYEGPEDVYAEMAANQLMASQEDPPAPKLDPTPWVFISDQVFGVNRSPVDKGYHDVSGTWWAFQPRPEYSQNREDYPPVLDPKPWRYDLIATVPVERRAREATQVTGGFSFAPRPGYVQKREDYS